MSATDNQRAFIASESMFVCLLGDKCSGKTFAGCQKVLDMAFDRPGSVGMFASSSRELLQNALRYEMAPLLKVTWKEYKISAPENAVSLSNGSKILFRAFRDKHDYLKIGGLNLDHFFIDDAHDFRRDSFDTLLSRVLRRSSGRGFVASLPVDDEEHFVNNFKPGWHYIGRGCKENANI